MKTTTILLALAVSMVTGFHVPLGSHPGFNHKSSKRMAETINARSGERVNAAFVRGTLLTAALSLQLATGLPALADDGASTAAGAKIQTGGASTLQSGRTIAITRGVNLDRSDFSNQNLKGVAFQQSIVRDANFKNSNLFSASFFDATLDGSDFENCDMSQVRECKERNEATGCNIDYEQGAERLH